MYSPALLPSRCRAAPAKNRIWSIIGGTSSDATRCAGFPQFSTSNAMSSAALASTASAIRISASDRSLGVASRHAGNAASAAAIARSMSTAPLNGAVAYARPVTGLITSVVAPSAESANSPLTKFWKVFIPGS